MRCGGGGASRVLSDEEWLAVRAAAQVAESDASSVLVEFVDVECPFCARIVPLLDSLEHTFGDSLEIGYAHFPLSQHRFARAGAAAIECARAEGRAESLLWEFLRKQDSVALLGVAGIAIRAGLSDTAKLRACLESGEASPIIEAGLSTGRRIGVRGTPSLVLNGELLGSDETFQSLAEKVRGGRARVGDRARRRQ